MMNTSEYEDNKSAHGHEDCGINQNVVAVVLPSLCFLVFVPALVLNAALTWVLLRLKTESTFTLYLKNLVAADLLMTLTVPVMATSSLPGAPLGLKTLDCRFASVIFDCCMNISVVLLGLISLDRFFEISRPCGCLLAQSRAFARVVCAAIWTVLLGGATLPTVVLTSGTPSRNCMDMKSQAGMKFHEAAVGLSNVLFWAVLVLIGFCYACITRKGVQSYRNSKGGERKRETEAMVLIVLTVFLVCFAPFYIVQIPYTRLQVRNKHTCMRASLKVAKSFTLWLATTNICLNPLIYFFLYENFRRKLSSFGRFSSNGLEDKSSNYE